MGFLLGFDLFHPQKNSVLLPVLERQKKKQTRKENNNKNTKQSTNPSIILSGLKILSFLDHTDVNKTDSNFTDKDEHGIIYPYFNFLRQT